MGKSTINGPCSIAMFVYQRVDQVESSCDVYPYCRDVLDYTGTKGAPVNTPDILAHVYTLYMRLLQWCCVTWRCGSCCPCDMEMFDQVLYGSSSWSDIGVDTLGVAWGAFGGVGGCDNVHDSMLLMGHLHWRDIRVDTLCTFRGTWVDVFPRGSCTWSDIRVHMLCTFRGTWVDMFPHELNRLDTVALSSLEKCEERRSEDRVELLERSKLISCGHGAKASFVAV